MDNYHSCQIIYNDKYDNKEKIYFFENLIHCAYSYNQNFKKFGKYQIIKNMNIILNDMKIILSLTNTNEIMTIISAMRLWTREDFPDFFGIERCKIYDTQIKKIEIIKKIKSSKKLFLDNIYY
jgi:hypothetical protein